MVRCVPQERGPKGRDGSRVQVATALSCCDSIIVDLGDARQVGFDGVAMREVHGVRQEIISLHFEKVTATVRYRNRSNDSTFSTFRVASTRQRPPIKRRECWL